MLRSLLLAAAIVVAAWIVAIVYLAVTGRKTQAKELAVFLPNLLVLFRGLLKDARVPRGSKIWLVFALVWIVSPIDLVPEFIPVLGPLDDAVVAGLVLRHLLKRTDRAIVAEYWRGDPAILERILPKI